MKKFLIVLLLLISFAFTAPIASSQVRHTRHKRTFWKKHRDKLTVAGTTAAGAVVGGVVDGKKGALIGAGSGAGAGALYTYKIRKRHRHRRL